jgi:hypothetical protein
MADIRKPTKTGNVQITRVGHTTSKTFGTDPMQMARGRNAKPTDISFGK